MGNRARNIGVENRARGWGEGCAVRLVQKSTLVGVGRGEAPGGRYVGQQHASLTVPMSQFAKSSNGTIRLPSIGDTKTSTTIIINNGYQFSWRR